MTSEQRKKSIKTLLKRGDLKQLANKLDMSYSYLSQAFSPASKFNFTDELARKVEKAMAWQPGLLDGLTPLPSKTKTSGLHLLALRGRAANLASCFPSKRVEINQSVKLQAINKNIDIIMYDEDGSVFVVADQSDDYKNPQNIEQLIIRMAITGTQYGVIFNANSGFGEAPSEDTFDISQKMSLWFEAINGKVVEVNEGPKHIFVEAGI